MDVIGHDNVSKKVVFLAVMKSQSLLHYVGDILVTQNTIAVSIVKVFFHTVRE